MKTEGYVAKTRQNHKTIKPDYLRTFLLFYNSHFLRYPSAIRKQYKQINFNMGFSDITKPKVFAG